MFYAAGEFAAAIPFQSLVCRKRWVNKILYEDSVVGIMFQSLVCRKRWVNSYRNRHIDYWLKFQSLVCRKRWVNQGSVARSPDRIAVSILGLQEAVGKLSCRLALPIHRFVSILGLQEAVGKSYP